MIKISFRLLLSLFIIGCGQSQQPQLATNSSPLTSYVNPFVGTGGHGHTYPGASAPFGMMQLSPDTRLAGWDGCSGYHYSDTYIYGFSHTHLSGTGVSDYADVLLMPTNQINFNNGADGKKGYRAYFSHENESASPGYYSVLLDSTNIQVELTVTKRAGIHKYQYPNAQNQFAILDLLHRDKVLDASIEIVSDTEIQGFRNSEAWATDQRLFFSIKTSHPFKDMLQSPPIQGMAGGQKAALQFINPNNEPVYISVGISAVDVQGAKQNRLQELDGKSFQEIKTATQNDWELQLQKIVVESGDAEVLANFYTSLYHTMLAPNLYQDVDGRYRGMDLEIHQTTDFDYYTVFSLWDTYRAAHPLYTIIEPERTNDFINTFLAKYKEGGIMPIWDLSANYTGCMIGYHAVPVIADAYLKGIRGFDAELAFKAMKHSAMQDKLGLEGYKNFGFVPMEQESESVSKTLEYAYDDWTIAQMAQALNKPEDYAYFTSRAQYYKNVFNPETGFFQGRFRNTWFSPFDPYEVNFNYTEANAWQYSLYAPQDINGLANLMGGLDKLEAHLDELFTAEVKTSGRDQADITGLIGQYAHGNEPSHHMAYLYNFVGAPQKTQERVSQITKQLYSNAPDGISGNEDCGQMSAWYVFSALGFYPVTPGSNQYIIGTPAIEKASILVGDGIYFNIEAINISDDNIYIQSVRLNGQPLNQSYLSHDQIIAGGNLVFTMGESASNWGQAATNSPSTEITQQLLVQAPFIVQGDVAFKEQTQVSLSVNSEATKIHYAFNSDSFKIYNEPLVIKEPGVLKTYATQGANQSATISTQFYKVDPNRAITLESDYANQYNAGGNDALIDGIRGSRDFRTGAWQGYQDKDVVAIVDLGRVMPIDSIKVSFLQEQRSWIFLPTQVECYVSDNPRAFYKSLPEVTFDSATNNEETKIASANFSMRGYSARYVKIVAKNIGDLPDWHLGAPYNGKAWIFIDEIDIN